MSNCLQRSKTQPATLQQQKSATGGQAAPATAETPSGDVAPALAPIACAHDGMPGECARSHQQQQQQQTAGGPQAVLSYAMPSEQDVNKSILSGNNTASKTVAFEITTCGRHLLEGVLMPMKPENVESVFRVHPRSTEERTGERVGDLSRVVVTSAEVVSAFLDFDLPLHASLKGLPTKVYPLSANCGTKSGRDVRFHHLIMPGSDVPPKPRRFYQRRKFQLLQVARVYGGLSMDSVRAGINPLPREPQDVGKADYIDHSFVPNNSLVMEWINANADGWNLAADGFDKLRGWNIIPTAFVEFVIGAIQRLLQTIKHDNLYDLGLQLSPVSVNSMKAMTEAQLSRPITVVVVYNIDYVFPDPKCLEAGWRSTAAAAPTQGGGGGANY